MGVRPPADLPAAPAVYAIGTVANGKVYVGGSLNARRRVEHHRYILRQGEHATVTCNALSIGTRRRRSRFRARTAACH
jgi:hypothetical protein